MGDLGKAYFWGSGVEQSMEQALFWYKKGAEAGNSYAQFLLGHYYLIKDDKTSAIYWWRKSAEQGYADAKTMLLLWDI